MSTAFIQPVQSLPPSKSQLFPLPKLTLSLTRTLSHEASLQSHSSCLSAPPERETWLGSLTSGMGLSKTRARTDSAHTRPVVVADVSDRPKAGILLNRTSPPSTPQIKPPSEQSSLPTTPSLLPLPALNPPTPNSIQHSNSAPMPHSSAFQLPPSATLTPAVPPLLPGHALHPSSVATPRSLTIKFAPLPDPRATKHRTFSAGENTWISSDSTPEASPASFNPLAHRSHLNPSPIDMPSPAAEPQHGRPDFSFDLDSSKYLDKTLRRPVSPAPPSHPTQSLHRATSSDSFSAASLTSSCVPPSISADSRREHPHGSSLAQKFRGAISKQRAPRSFNGSTSNLSSVSSTDYGSPLRHSRSAESSAQSYSSFGSRSGMPGCLWKSSPLQLRRTRSKDDEPRPRRRAQYPPVAQRKVHMGGSRGGAGRVAIVEEPAFVEWEASASVSLADSTRSRQTYSSSTRTSEVGSSLRSEAAGLDDGSGMAWLKKRRREREERVRREAEAAAALSAIQAAPAVVLPPADPATNQDVNEVQIIPLRPQEVLAESNMKEDKLTIKTGSSNLNPASGFSSSGSSSSALTTAATSSLGVEEEEEEEEAEAEDEEEDEEEVRKEDLLKAKVLAESPFVKGVKEVYTDREHHRMTK